eukprot:3715175-Pyramimonas_sp.AAC.1
MEWNGLYRTGPDWARTVVPLLREPGGLRHWTGLDWTGLDCAGLYRTRPDWARTVVPLLRER